MESHKWLHLYAFFQLSPQIVCPKRCKVALVAFLHFFTWGSFQMFSQIACLNRWKVALIAFERLFTWGSFQMFSQIACMNRCKVTNGCICTFFFQLSPQIVCMNKSKVPLIAFVCFSPEWVFKCVLKLPASTDHMHSSIDCIWTIFHLREFSDVFSNRLPEQMESHIDCIWTTFHLREFSNVFSGRLHE